jgi:hypothetical protein
MGPWCGDIMPGFSIPSSYGILIGPYSLAGSWPWWPDGMTLSRTASEKGGDSKSGWQ